MNLVNDMADLYLLVQVVEAGSFSAAAEQLGTTRSLLSRRIMALEQRLGVQLLHRNARQFSITPVGEEVYRHASSMRECALAAQRAATQADAGTRFVRISAPPLLVPLVSELLPLFSTVHPHTRVWLTQGSGDMEPLLRQQADVVLTVRETLPDSGDVVARALGSFRLVTVAAAELVERVGRPAHPAHVDAGQALVYAGPGSPSGLLFHPATKGQARMTSGDLHVLLSAARAGIGFAQLPAYMCRDDIGAGRLQTVLDAFEPVLQAHALTLSGRRVGDAAMAFVRFAQEHIGRNHG
jgi:DNA-binding transcriptional LysR family regulator